jgi:neutral amino acid transport system ATP-binding protein
MPDPILLVEGLVAGYIADVDIVRGVDIVVHAGEIVTVVGPNGAGKSTVLKAISGLLRPRAGTVAFAGEMIHGVRPHRIARAGLGYVPQRANVFASMTVEDNLDLGAMPFSVDARRQKNEAYDLFPRLRERRRQYAGTLSGGERQMLAIARSLMGQPRLLLLDEPSAGVAPMLVDLIFEKTMEINERGTTILMVEQNARRALAISHRGYVLDLGSNRYTGTGSELLEDPRVVDLYLGGTARLDRAATTEEPA